MSGAERRLLGIDLGDARIGLALSDPTATIARPLATLERIGPRRDLRQVELRVREHDVDVVVIGLPLLLSGCEGARAGAAREFASALAQRLPAAKVELWDERLTTVEAERTMIRGGLRRRKRREIVDVMAAVLILQSYLDAQGART